MRNKKNAILISIIVVFALIFVGAVGYLIYGMIRNQSSEDEYKNIPIIPKVTPEILKTKPEQQVPSRLTRQFR